MDQPTSLKIDLSNPAEIRSKIPDIEEIVAEKDVKAREASQDFESWRALLGKLKLFAGLVVRVEMPPPPKYISSPDAVNAVVQVVDREQRPILPLGVEKGLLEDGHEVESREAVKTALMNAVLNNRIQQFGESFYAPNSFDEEAWEEIGGLPALQAVPEAHLGLDGPPPQSKSEAVIRVLAQDPKNSWSAPAVAEAMVGQGWIDYADSEVASIAATLSRLHTQGKLFRPHRGQYQLAPPSTDPGQ